MSIVYYMRAKSLIVTINARRRIMKYSTTKNRTEKKKIIKDDDGREKRKMKCLYARERDELYY